MKAVLDFFKSIFVRWFWFRNENSINTLLKKESVKLEKVLEDFSIPEAQTILPDITFPDEVTELTDLVTELKKRGRRKKVTTETQENS